MSEFGFVLAGFGVGLVVGLTGVGGGSLMTPLLIFGFGIKPHIAVGTDLLFAAFTKLGGTVAMARRQLVPWTVVARLSAGSLPAAGLSLWLLQALGPASDAVQHLITRTLGVALLLTAAASLHKVVFGPRAARSATAQSTPADEPTQARQGALPVLFGACIGCLVTLTSVGAGAIGVTALMLLYPRLPLPRIVGADIAYAVPLTLLAGLGHVGLGNVDGALLLWLLAGSLPGIWLGSRGVARVHEGVTRSALSALLAWAGFKLVLI